MTLHSDISKQLSTGLANEKQETITYLNKRIIHKDNESDKGTMTSTPIQEFYKNQTIFITGGTGFIGKVLIEKLSRSCSGISRIYVLIRKKKDKDPDERIQNLLKHSVFNTVRSSIPDFAEKIIGVTGDCSQNNLGLRDDDILLLKKEVSIIFHCAATVRFDETLKQAAVTNIQSTMTITDFCKEMKNLKAFVYLSTAFAHCFNTSTIEEKFYDYPITHKDLLTVVNSLPEKIVDAITPALMDKLWVNTYTCTKAMTENFLETECNDLPVAIFRPVIVTPSAYEPILGWVDNYYGLTGVFAGVMSGILRTLHCNNEKRANLAPVDLTVNALIASAWDCAIQKTRRGRHMLIYNFTDAPIKWSFVRQRGLKYIHNYPLNMSLWYATLKFTKYEFMCKFCRLFLHSIPAFVIDLLARVTGRNPQMTKLYERMHKMSDLMKPIIQRGWDIDNEEVQNLWDKLDANDQNTFKFTMQDFDWDKYFLIVVKGIRIHMFNDDLESLEESRLRYKKLFLMNQALRISLVASAYYILRKVLQKPKYKPPY